MLAIMPAIMAMDKAQSFSQRFFHRLAASWMRIIRAPALTAATVPGPKGVARSYTRLL